jgi:glyoxylase-like metal-dependent hydrolase (beta-lactamase superfamily II)
VIVAVLAAAVLAAGPSSAPPAPPRAALVAPGVWLIPGSFLPKRQPDGATVIFEAPQGLVVMDTGRHPWHRQAILDFARARNAPIVAIVNSHWHLDHVSGNPDLKRAYPRARVYASLAIDDALRDFLPKSAADAQGYLEGGKLAPETLEDLRADMATIQRGAELRPDVPVTRSARRRLGGLALAVNLAPNAATDGDVWVYDARSGVAAVGDLLTLPAPFLDTACVKGWRAALDQVWATPFRLAVPGHGPVLTRAQFAAYRAAFTALAECSAAGRGKAECASAWMAAIRPLDPGDPVLRYGQGMTEGYVEMLRAHGGDSAYCKTPSGPRRALSPAASDPVAPGAI